VNLIAGEKVVPELVQHDFTPDAVVAAMRKIIPEGAERAEMLAGLQLVKNRLQGMNAETNAPKQAAKAILALAGREGVVTRSRRGQ
jgi:lipid-A-disaccharide synthase